MDDFKSLNIAIEISNEKDYEYCGVEETTVLDMKYSFEALKEQKKVKDKVEVINLQPVKTNNSFINAVNDNELNKLKSEKLRVAKSDVKFPYIKADLFTNAELQLYHFLRNNLDFKEKVAIFPKVRLADLISVDPKISLDMQAFYKIAYKHVDYVICKYDTLEVICAVELDDFYHERDDRKERDMFVMEALYTAGIEVIRINVPIKTICKADIEYLDERINTFLAPNCAQCGAKMIPRKSQSRMNKGHRFFSCPNSIAGCRHTVNIDQIGEKLP